GTDVMAIHRASRCDDEFDVELRPDSRIISEHARRDSSMRMADHHYRLPFLHSRIAHRGSDHRGAWGRIGIDRTHGVQQGMDVAGVKALATRNEHLPGILTFG